MITEDQTAVIDFLASPAAHGGATVERIDTHASTVFLSGTRALKLKRAVRFDYLDFSTRDDRKRWCDAEVRLNRRTAPMLYRGVVAVTRERDGSLALGGSGTPVDWVVVMNRFEQDALFDRLAASGRLDLGLMPALAGAIARFHRVAEPRPDHGGKAGMDWVVEGNAAAFAESAPRALEPSASFRVTDDSCAQLERHGVLLDDRRDAGFVRHCHGDLHLRNIVLLDGHPTLFDGVEFNDEIACVDVLYDLAFLLMDLWRRQLPRHANAVWNGYLADTTDLNGVALMPLFLSCRAAIRAKTSVTAAGLQQNTERAGELRRMAREYLALAGELLHPPRASLIAVGGLSGSGKSTLALGLAPGVGAVPGAVVLRSDETRKRLCGGGPLERLGPEGYAPDVSRRVYATLAEYARILVHAGHSVIVDAVYAGPADRRAIEGVAAEASVPFVGLWLDAPEATRLERVQRRRHDPSDADANVVQMQQEQTMGVIGWHRLDGSASPDDVVRAATTWLHDRADYAATSSR